MYTKQEVEQFRKPSEFIAWFDQVIERINAAPDEEARREVFLRTGWGQFFYGEIHPLWRLLMAKRNDWQESSFKNVIGNQPYDVEVLGHPLKYLEIATADWEEEEKVRYTELVDKGSVSLTSPMLRGKRGKRGANDKPVGVDPEMQFADHSDQIRRRVGMIEDRISRKSKKSYQNGTGLIVSFRDNTGWPEDDHAIYKTVVEAARSVWEPTFENIFLVGESGTLFLEAERSR